MGNPTGKRERQEKSTYGILGDMTSTDLKVVVINQLPRSVTHHLSNLLVFFLSKQWPIRLRGKPRHQILVTLTTWFPQKTLTYVHQTQTPVSWLKVMCLTHPLTPASSKCLSLCRRHYLAFSSQMFASKMTHKKVNVCSIV